LAARIRSGGNSTVVRIKAYKHTSHDESTSDRKNDSLNLPTDIVALPADDIERAAIEALAALVPGMRQLRAIAPVLSYGFSER
jgi:hypothetical protein